MVYQYYYYPGLGLGWAGLWTQECETVSRTMRLAGVLRVDRPGSG